jgi:hypothetical protein
VPPRTEQRNLESTKSAANRFSKFRSNTALQPVQLFLFTLKNEPKVMSANREYEEIAHKSLPCLLAAAAFSGMLALAWGHRGASSTKRKGF